MSLAGGFVDLRCPGSLKSEFQNWRLGHVKHWDSRELITTRRHDGGISVALRFRGLNYAANIGCPRVRPLDVDPPKKTAKLDTAAHAGCCPGTLHHDKHITTHLLEHSWGTGFANHKSVILSDCFIFLIKCNISQNMNKLLIRHGSNHIQRRSHSLPILAKSLLSSCGICQRTTA